MYQGQLTTDLTQTVQRINAYHSQVTDWLASLSPKDPDVAVVRAKVVTLKDKLNKARIGIGMVRRLPTPVALDLGGLDKERMTQDLDRTVERFNTYVYQLEAGRDVLPPSDPLLPVVTEVARKLRTAKEGLRAAREAAQAIAGCDYRGDELLMII